jgi:hypothetical protein
MAIEPNVDGSYDVDGVTIAMPVEVRAARQAAATFLVPHAAAVAVFGECGLNPTNRSGKSIVSVALVDYTDNDLGSYKELALAVVVDDAPGTPPTPKGSVSTLIHRLPVSEQFTCAAGRGIWGFPKWVADLRVDFNERGASATLRNDDGDEVLSVTMRRGPIPLPRRPLEMNAYAFSDGVLRRTPWVTNGTGHQRVRPGGTTLRIGVGHPIAAEMRRLGLPRRALMTMFDDHMRATFGKPETVD